VTLTACGEFEGRRIVIVIPDKQGFGSETENAWSLSLIAHVTQPPSLAIHNSHHLEPVAWTKGGKKEQVEGGRRVPEHNRQPPYTIAIHGFYIGDKVRHFPPSLSIYPA
jgi:hypothetical protein